MGRAAEEPTVYNGSGAAITFSRKFPHPSSPADGRSVLSVTTIRGPGGITRVLAAGEIDWASIGSLDRALEHEPASDTTALVVDLSRVSFCSSCGLHLLTSLRLRAKEAGVPLELVVDTHIVRRVLQASGLWPLFSIHPDHGSALAKLTTGDH